MKVRLLLFCILVTFTRCQEEATRKMLPQRPSERPITEAIGGKSSNNVSDRGQPLAVGSLNSRQERTVRDRFQWLIVTAGQTSFSDWNSWRSEHGLLCRSSSDCSWLDRRLQCNNRTILENNPTMLNGETATGQCGCRRFYDWVDSQFVCQPQQQLGGRGGPDRTRDYGGRRYGGDYGGRRYGGDYEGGRFGDYFGYRPQRTLHKDKIQLAGTLNEDQEEKLQEKFSEWNNRDWTYDEWNAWRKEDGLLCRTADDCRWLGGAIKCENYDKFAWTINPGWFNGGRVRGQCECEPRHSLEDMECRAWKWRPPGRQPGKMSTTETALIITAIVILVIICTICVCICG